MTMTENAPEGGAPASPTRLQAFWASPFARQWVHPLLKRLGDLAILLFALTTLLFFLLRVAGDPAQMLAGPEASPEVVAAIQAKYGLDQPVMVQYLRYMGNILTGDFGTSLASGQPAMGEVLAHLPPTLLMAGLGMGFTILVSLSLGAWLGFRPDRPSRRLTAWLVFILQGVPGFVIGLLLIQVFAVENQLLPSMGMGIDSRTGAIDPRHWILPTLALAGFLVPQLTRVVAANVAECMREDYIRTARANGASSVELLWRHALPNALLAATALIGTQFAFLVSGAVIIEILFTWPGIGWLLLKSTQTLDFPIVQAIAFVIALMVFLVNSVTDLMFRVLDPRLRRQRS